LALEKPYVDRLLYVSRELDGEILTLLDERKNTIGALPQLESDRGAGCLSSAFCI